jgi:hypothetical protein
MSINIIDNGKGEAALYDAASKWAFGPVLTSREEAEKFLAWLGKDARQMRDSDLEQAFYDFQQAQDEAHNEARS